MKFISDKSEHGDVGNCPMCGALGHFDDSKHGVVIGHMIFDDAIWKNIYDDQWECYNCWLK